MLHHWASVNLHGELHGASTSWRFVHDKCFWSVVSRIPRNILISRYGFLSYELHCPNMCMCSRHVTIPALFRLFSQMSLFYNFFQVWISTPWTAPSWWRSCGWPCSLAAWWPCDGGTLKACCPWGAPSWCCYVRSKKRGGWGSYTYNKRDWGRRTGTRYMYNTIWPKIWLLTLSSSCYTFPCK